jgi:hypothetical protein
MRAKPWLVVIATVIATQVIWDNIGLAWWLAGCSLILLGLVGHFANLWLIFRYIRKTVPEMASVDPDLPSELPQPWELTAGTGIVPRWVSGLAFVAYGCLISGALFLVATTVRLIRGLPTTPP